MVSRLLDSKGLFSACRHHLSRPAQRALQTALPARPCFCEGSAGTFLGLFQPGAGGVRSGSSGSQKRGGALCLLSLSPRKPVPGDRPVAWVLGAEGRGQGGQGGSSRCGELAGFWARTLMGSTDGWLGALDSLWLPVAAARSPPPSSPAVPQARDTGLGVLSGVPASSGGKRPHLPVRRLQPFEACSPRGAPLPPHPPAPCACRAQDDRLPRCCLCWRRGPRPETQRPRDTDRQQEGEGPGKKKGDSVSGVEEDRKDRETEEQQIQRRRGRDTVRERRGGGWRVERDLERDS